MAAQTATHSIGHLRHHSTADAQFESLRLKDHRRPGAGRGSTPTGTFAPQFIQADRSGSGSERAGRIEGENDFSGKRYVWIKDAQEAFIKAWVIDEPSSTELMVQCEDGSVSTYLPTA